MKKTIYIIPGFGETCKLGQYQRLSKKLKGNIKFVNPNWHEPLQRAVFKVSKNDLVIGFSYGAVIAYLIAKKYGCKAILASLSPIREFSYAEVLQDYQAHMPLEKAKENTLAIKKIKISFLKTPYVTLAGTKENLKANVLIHGTGHRLNGLYIQAIANIANL